MSDATFDISIAFACNSSGASSPRSAKTLPLLGVISRLRTALLLSPALVIRFRELEACLHEIDVRLRCRSAAPRLLLESMEHVDPSFETHRVHRAKRVPVEIVDDLKDAGTPESLERLGACALL